MNKILFIGCNINQLPYLKHLLKMGFKIVGTDQNQNFKRNQTGGGVGNRFNGGYFILSPKVIDYIKDDKSVWEKQPLEKLAKDKELACWFHDNFWIPMDTLRDKHLLEDLWKNQKAPWKVLVRHFYEFFWS